MSPRLTHFAINTDDVESTQSFYAEVFGWSFQAYGPPGFVQIVDEVGGSPIGAIQQRRQLLPDDATRGFECSFGVDDVDDIRRRVVDAGGAILMERSTIPGVGYLLAFQDPGGNPVLAMQYDADAPLDNPTVVGLR
ncbi:MAG: VOC family protein [Ilumatobacter sp.]|uniref:VOC family protein n=1 Tax=Ilumatobacter sp. TaxID=1967498 RepID=UPI003C72A2F7